LVNVYEIFLLDELLTINETHEPDLYWALRGVGRGLFIIVTELKFQLVKTPSLITRFSSLWYPNATKLVHVEILIIYFGIELEEFNKTISLLLATLPTPNENNIHEQIQQNIPILITLIEMYRIG
jgi:hypothetical protein